MNFNRVILAGNLTRDPELRYTPNGTAVAKFGLAINRVWVGEDQQKKEEVTFVDITAWGRTAEVIGQHFKKGRPMHVEGRLKLDQWEDKTTHQKMQKLSVVLETFQFVGNKPDGSSPPSSTSPARRPASSAPGDSSTEPGGDNPGDDDDVPF